MRTFTGRFVGFGLAALLLVSFAFTSTHSLRAQDAMASKVTCDSDLILSLYTAEYHFDFGKVHDQMMADHPDMKTVDLSVFEQGQYAPLFTSMMSMMGNDMGMGMMDEATTKSVMDAMAMSPADLDKGMMAMMPTETSADAMMTELASGSMMEEPAECTALRDELRQFYTALAYSSMMMSESK